MQAGVDVLRVDAVGGEQGGDAENFDFPHTLLIGIVFHVFNRSFTFVCVSRYASGDGVWSVPGDHALVSPAFLVVGRRR